MLSTARFVTGLAAILLTVSGAQARYRHRNPAHEEPAPGVKRMITGYAHDFGVPAGLARAVMHIESGGNPRATNHGALGLMQIKPSTARLFGFGGSAAGLMSPATNLHYGIRVLADAYHTTGGNLCRTLAIYQSGSVPRRYNQAERSYCAKARAYMAGA